MERGRRADGDGRCGRDLHAGPGGRVAARGAGRGSGRARRSGRRERGRHQGRGPHLDGRQRRADRRSRVRERGGPLGPVSEHRGGGAARRRVHRRHGRNLAAARGVERMGGRVRAGRPGWMGRGRGRTDLENHVVATRPRGGACALGAMLAFAFAGVLAAQDRPPRIEGRVVDLDTGASVEGASIALVRLRAGVADSTRAETATDRAGTFQFERVASGDYRITVNHIAYGTFDDRVTLATGDRSRSA
ncbi:MAG: carboxypeptidase regulatory-like domain-containing protein [Gemmatimonadetes bacterium]|nr:carboxypeptidase regulatory-like domain-containing protein [Gemmatimonadota bacterium]